MPNLTKPSLSPFFTSSQDPYCIVGADGYFKAINPAFIRLLGHAAEELLSLPFTDFVHPDDREVFIKTTQSIFNGHSFQELEIRFRKKDGTYFMVTWMTIACVDGFLYMMGMGNGRQQLISKAIIAGQEQQRVQIGRELHDNINQMVTALKLHLQVAREKEHLCREQIGKCETISTAIIEEIRVLSRQLLPPLLEKGCLATAIEELLATYNSSQPFTTYFTYRGQLERLPADLQHCTYRIIQEGLNNIIKHAGATEVIIKLKEGNHLSLTIQDNGRGFDPTKRQQGIGITNIKSRAAQFRGKVNVLSAPGKGCRLELHFADIRKLPGETNVMVNGSRH